MYGSAIKSPPPPPPLAHERAICTVFKILPWLLVAFLCYLLLFARPSPTLVINIIIIMKLPECSDTVSIQI